MVRPSPLQPDTATLVKVVTSPQCLSVRLVMDGKTIWSNRVFNRPEGEAGAMKRMQAYAERRRLWVEDMQGHVVVGVKEQAS